MLCLVLGLAYLFQCCGAEIILRPRAGIILRPRAGAGIILRPRAGAEISL